MLLMMQIMFMQSAINELHGQAILNHCESLDSNFLAIMLSSLQFIIFFNFRPLLSVLSQCPSSYPWSFSNGTRCCKYFFCHIDPNVALDFHDPEENCQDSIPCQAMPSTGCKSVGSKFSKQELQ